MSNAKARDAAYSKIIGRDYESFVDAEGEPRIEVRRYQGKPVKNGPECDVWVTAGMSDVEMTDDDAGSKRLTSTTASTQGAFP